MTTSARKFLWMATVFALSAFHNTAFCCGACYGAADSSQTHGMNFAILSMLGITGGVLGTMSSFFLYLRKRARAYGAVNEIQEPAHDKGGIQ